MTTTFERTTINDFLPVADIIPTPDNPRVISEKDPAFIELANDVTSRGVLIHVHVRPHPEQDGKWDLRCGERRLRAAIKAKRKSIPAIVHHGMDDAEAFELTFTENYARADLTPIEEGRAVATLLDRFGGDVKSVATKLDRSEKWVRLRSRLKDLSAKWQAALADQDGWAMDWGVGHLELVARFEPDVQDAIFDQVGRDWRVTTSPTVDQLDGWLNDHFLRLLCKAPWPLLDEAEGGVLNPDAVACRLCRKRSDVQRELFHGEQEDDLSKSARCLDPVCWERKIKARTMRAVEQAEAKHGKGLRLVEQNYYGQARKDVEAQFGKITSIYDVDKCKKADEGAMPAVIVDGPNAGKTMWVKEQERGRSAKPAAQTPEEKAEQAQLKVDNRVLELVGDAIEKLPLPKKITERQMLALMATFTPEPAPETREAWEEDGPSDWDRYLEVCGSKAKAMETAWMALRAYVPAEVLFGYGRRAVDRAMQVARGLCELCGLDFEGFVAEAEKGITAGTQKKVQVNDGA